MQFDLTALNLANKHNRFNKPSTPNKIVSRKRQLGFTMIEILSSLSISAVVMGMGVPMMVDIVKNSQLTSIANEYAGAVNYGRSTAITEQKTVTLCSSSTGSLCTASAWSAGWMMYLVEADSSRRILAVGQPLDTGIDVNFNGFDMADRISFQVTGTIDGTSNTGDIVVCDDRGASFANSVLINAIGRPVVASDSNGDGIVEGNSGSNVACSS